MSRKAEKKLGSYTLPTWKKEAVQELSIKRAVNISQLIENLLTDYFGEELEAYRPSEEDQDVEKPSKKMPSTSRRKAKERDSAVA